MLPFEFTVEGPPVSNQTRAKPKLRAWREMVRQAAANRWAATAPLVGALRIVVTYYHEGPAIRMDNDNMLKPIQDALIGLVYRDDKQLTDASIRKTDIDGRFRVRGASLVLLEAFSHGKEFLHIRIESAPDHADFQK
jgi:crossover junction endodeoxyribonuclease RusA